MPPFPVFGEGEFAQSVVNLVNQGRQGPCRLGDGTPFVRNLVNKRCPLLLEVPHDAGDKSLAGGGFTEVSVHRLPPADIGRRFIRSR